MLFSVMTYNGLQESSHLWYVLTVSQVGNTIFSVVRCHSY